MKNKTKNIILITMLAMLLASLFCNGLLFYNQHNSTPPECIRTSSDTFYIHTVDTIKVPSYKIAYKDSIILDTIYVHDTILYRELKHYADSIADIYISGIEPALDSVQYKLNRDTVVVTNEIEKTFIKKQRIGLVWSIAPYVGYGAQLNNGQIHTGWEVGVGASIGLGGIIK